jgi:CheY-like chemotaxis protein
METLDTKKVILMADDDVDDFLLVKTALQDFDIPAEIINFANGVALMAYLEGEDPFRNRKEKPVPSVILLDLNMPVMDGREVLLEMAHKKPGNGIPVVVFTTSADPRDMQSCRELGAADYVVKPNTYGGLLDTMRYLAKSYLDA